MFGFGKNKAVDFVTDDVDKCINYLTIEASHVDRQQKATQIANTIRHWLEQIATGNATKDDVLEHLKRQKNSFLTNLGRDYYKSADGSATYICWCFFVFLLSHENSTSKIGIDKIFDLCENYCDPDAKKAVLQITRTLRLDLKIPALKAGQKEKVQETAPMEATANTVIRCPKCSQQCRVPAKKTLEITCPKCKHKWSQWTQGN